jgi:uncharacterized membrane protein YcaP (DUF421 family)
MLRQQGIESAAEVKRAYLESDGEVSVIRFPTPARGHDERPERGKDRRPIA